MKKDGLSETYIYNQYYVDKFPNEIYSECNKAARMGNLKLLKNLRAMTWPWNEETFTEAARSGNLKMLIWMKSEGCPWNKKTTECAAEIGNLKILEYLISEGCPWDVMVAQKAVINGHLEILKFIHKKCSLLLLNVDLINLAS